MSDKKRNILESLERIDFYGEANPQLATDLPFTVELFAANKANITGLNQAGIVSSSAKGASRSGTRSKVARSREIHSDLRRVARSARRAEKKFPEFRNTFILQAGRLSYQALVEKAEAYITDAPANRDFFDKYGLTTAFFANLQTNVTEFRNITQGQKDAQRTGVGATADTEDILNDALEVRADLKIAIENHYRNDPQKLAEWLTASHIKRKTDTDTPPDENPLADPPTE